MRLIEDVNSVKGVKNRKGNCYPVRQERSRNGQEKNNRIFK